MPKRHQSETSYRYAYNGMEQDPEVKGDGNSYTTEFRQYDPRVGRWLSLDPLMHEFPWMSPYVAFNNNPIYFIDPLGLEGVDPDKEKIPTVDEDFGEIEVTEIEDIVVRPQANSYPMPTIYQDNTEKSDYNHLGVNVIDFDNPENRNPTTISPAELKRIQLNGGQFRDNTSDQFNLIGNNSPTAKEPVMNGNEKGGGINPWGPGLIASGQPWFPKRFVTPGSSSGTSLASKVLDKALPIKSPVRLPTPVINSSGVRMAYTKSVGRFVSRWVPFIGWGLLAYDIYENKEAIQESAKSVEATREKAIDLYGPGIFCFEKGTLIYAHTGLVPIEKIMLGDSVYSYNDSNNTVELNRVVNLFVRETESIYELKFGSEIVYVTGEHPFFVIDKGWTPVKELKEGNLLKTENDEVELSAITILNRTVMVYNIEVDNNHNYFVTKQKALVHNKNIIGNNQFNSINENYNSEDEYEE